MTGTGFSGDSPAAGRSNAYGPDGFEAEVFDLRDIGPSHVLFWRRGQRERQQGYRIAAEALGAAWKQRLGRYQPSGDAMPGFDKIAEAELRLQDDGLPVRLVTYNTGTFTYPLVPVAADEARTGGLGPSMTGDAVSFITSQEEETKTCMGLTVRKAR